MSRVSGLAEIIAEAYRENRGQVRLMTIASIKMDELDASSDDILAAVRMAADQLEVSVLS